jgi:hypothetical protein
MRTVLGFHAKTIAPGETITLTAAPLHDYRPNRFEVVCRRLFCKPRFKWLRARRWFPRWLRSWLTLVHAEDIGEAVWIEQVTINGVEHLPGHPIPVRQFDSEVPVGPILRRFVFFRCPAGRDIAVRVRNVSGKPVKNFSAVMTGTAEPPS